MKHSLAGRPRKLTDEQVRMIREWKPLTQLRKEIGICRHWAQQIRAGYQHKTKSP